MPACEKAFKGLDTDPFYELVNQTIWRRCREMWQSKTAIDLVTLGQHLRDAGELDDVGGYGHLSSLMDEPPSAANLGYYLEILVEKAARRQTIAMLAEAEAAA